MTPLWDERYDCEEYVYGTEPNAFLRGSLESIPRGTVLSLAEGEGRNAVFLAEQGYDVVGVDSSAVGLKKAQALASKRGVTVTTILADLAGFEIEPQSFNAVICFFLHLPPPVRRTVFARAVKGLRPGGAFVMEAFTPRQLAYESGGPKDPELLIELEDVKRDLAGLEFTHAQELLREFDEGTHHQGLGSVVQIIGVKPDPPRH